MEKNKFASEMLEFIRKSPSCFHAVENLSEKLKAAGFTELFEKESWKLKAGGKYFVKRNGSSIISFLVPERNFKGFLISASHSDSPCFKIKENPEMESAGCVRLNVEKYGGMLIQTWFDKPLSAAGRISVVKNKDGRISIEEKLFDFERDLLMIPNLAIHMNRDANDGHKIDVQKEMVPVLTTEKGSSLKKMISEKSGISEENISGWDLYLYNRTAPVFWGKNEEFIASPKLDDLECVYSTFCGFLDAVKESEGCKIPPENVLVHAVFDNEETGSQSRQGAGSTFLQDVLVRLNESLGRSHEEYLQAVAESFVVSADNAHAVHPNYAGTADPVNQPEVNKGIVIKFNAAQKYTSDSVTASYFKEVLKKAEVPFQVFTNNSNIAGGSTLGNISTSQVSAKSVDIGLAQWAMHSNYESAGALDPEYMMKGLKEFYTGKYEF